MNNRAKTVIATEPMMHQPTWSFVSDQLLADHLHQGRDAEPGEEAQEEGEPRHVERTHGRRGNVEQIDARCFAVVLHEFLRRLGARSGLRR